MGCSTEAKKTFGFQGGHAPTCRRRLPLGGRFCLGIAGGKQAGHNGGGGSGTVLMYLARPYPPYPPNYVLVRDRWPQTSRWPAFRKVRRVLLFLRRTPSTTSVPNHFVHFGVVMDFDVRRIFYPMMHGFWSARNSSRRTNMCTFCRVWKGSGPLRRPYRPHPRWPLPVRGRKIRRIPRRRIRPAVQALFGLDARAICAEAPVAITTVSANTCVLPSMVTLKGRVRSRRCLWRCRSERPYRTVRPGVLRPPSSRAPLRLSGYPRKFSTSLVIINWPPGLRPTYITGFISCAGGIYGGGISGRAGADNQAFYFFHLGLQNSGAKSKKTHAWIPPSEKKRFGYKEFLLRNGLISNTP